MASAWSSSWIRETFDIYNRPGLHGEACRFASVDSDKRFSPPTLTKTWFHQGPVGEEFGDWQEKDLSGEYWPGDPQVLKHVETVNEFLKTFRSAARSVMRCAPCAAASSAPSSMPWTVRSVRIAPTR